MWGNEMAISTSTVLVAGGGIGGLTAALLLARAGAAVTLVERSADPAEVGAGLLLHPNGLAVLQGLGLGEQVISAGVNTNGGSVRDETGKVINQIASPDYGPGLDRLVAVRRSALNSVLLTAVRAEKGIDCTFGTRVVGAAADGAVTVEMAAPTGRSRMLTADLVVGADGVGSVVRATGHFDAGLRRTGHRYLRVIVDDDRGTDIGGEYWTTLGLFGGARIDEHHLYFYADVTAPSGRGSGDRRRSAPPAKELGGGASVGRRAAGWGAVVRPLADQRRDDGTVPSVVRRPAGAAR
jgi:2-polyprenyl-6-methoxyphenol hydroxylase-like FAD-dependent oxidoreductase